MKTPANKPLSYLQHIEDEPMETYWQRRTDQLRRAITEHPEDEVRLLQQLLIYASVNDDHDETLRLAERLLLIDTDKEYNDDAYHIMARTYAALNETEKAIEYYKKTIEIEIKPDSRFGYITEEVIMELAEIYEARKDWENALKTYDLLDHDEIRDGKEMMYRHKGDIYMRQNKTDIASQYFDKAIECCMEYEWLVRKIGNMHIQKNLPESLIDHFKKDTENEDGKAEAYCRLGLIYQDKDDDLLAMHYYTEALKLKPCFPEAHNNMALLAFDQQGDLQKSASLLHLAKEDTNETIKNLRKEIEIANDKITDLESDIEESADKDIILAKQREIREAETKIFHKESDIEHYQWLLTLFDLNLSRVYNKMTDFGKAAHYKSEFLGNVGFACRDDDDDDDDDDI